jgi:thiol-disulfide isomerase/thioredoxin
MAMTTRRLLYGATGLAAVAVGTLAAATLGRKSTLQVYVPVNAPATPAATPGAGLLPISRLVATDPPAPLPAFGFTDALGAPHTIAEFAGKGVVLNLWATWCAPCVAELPSLVALAGRLAPEGIVVLPLSTDRGGARVVREFYDSHGINGLGVWLDPKGAGAEALGAHGLPTTLVLDRQGRERGRLEGGADWGSDAAVERIRALVG